MHVAHEGELRGAPTAKAQKEAATAQRKHFLVVFWFQSRWCVVYKDDSNYFCLILFLFDSL